MSAACDECDGTGTVSVCHDGLSGPDKFPCGACSSRPAEEEQPLPPPHPELIAKVEAALRSYDQALAVDCSDYGYDGWVSDAREFLDSDYRELACHIAEALS